VGEGRSDGKVTGQEQFSMLQLPYGDVESAGHAFINHQSLAGSSPLRYTSPSWGPSHQ